MDSTQGAALVHLSPSARHVLSIDFGRAYEALVVERPGAVEAMDVLETLKPSEMIEGVARDVNAAGCALAGLWLWHDFLPESHTICQAIDTPSGSLWHAVLHRREGDFSNAKYWLRQAGAHPIFASMSARVNALTHELPTDKAFFRLTASGWNPGAFVDLAEAVHGDPADARRAAVVTIQRIEWQTLFEYCLREAAGQ